MRLQLRYSGSLPMIANAGPLRIHRSRTRRPCALLPQLGADHQVLGVLMLRIGDELTGRPFLHQLPLVQDHGAVGHLKGKAEVMGNEQDSQVALLSQALDQFDRGTLHHHVKGGGDLVADQQLRVCRKSAGKADALALPAGKLMGQGKQMVFPQTHFPKQADRPSAGLFPGAPMEVPKARIRGEVQRTGLQPRLLAWAWDASRERGSRQGFLRPKPRGGAPREPRKWRYCTNAPSRAKNLAFLGCQTGELYDLPGAFSCHGGHA